MLRFFKYKKAVAIIAILAYISIFYFKLPLELFFKWHISKLLNLGNTELWRVKFITGILLDFAAVAFLQLIIYCLVDDKKYSSFCMLVFLVIYMLGIFSLLFTVFYKVLFINKLAYFLFNLATDPFLTLVLIGAYPIFRFENTENK